MSTEAAVADPVLKKQRAYAVLHTQKDCEDNSSYWIIIPCIAGLIMLVGPAGNSIVLAVIRFNCKLQTLTNFMICHLAAVDSMCLVFWGAFLIILHFRFNWWPLGRITCKMIHYFHSVTYYVTIWTLVGVAAVRYVSVVTVTSHPMRAQKLLTTKMAKISLALMWLVSFGLNVPAFLNVDVQEIKKAAGGNTTTICGILPHQNGTEAFAKGRAWAAFSFGYVAPTAIIFALYALIYHHLVSADARCRRHHCSPNSRTRRAREVFVFLVCTFALCQLPLHIHMLLLAHDMVGPRTCDGSEADNKNDTNKNQIEYSLFLSWLVIQVLNNALNPIIYALTSSRFRKCFVSSMPSALLCRSKRVQENNQKNLNVVGDTPMGYSNGRISSADLE